jgi:hypothetical protein
MATNFSISTFREALKSGSRPNLFRIDVTIPATLISSGVNVGGYSTLVRSAALPSATIGTIELPMNGGRRFKLGGDRVFTEWTSTVLNDENYTLRSSLEAWQDQMVFNNFEIGSSLGNRSATAGATADVPAGLYGTIQIYQLDETGASITNGSYRLVNCWPSDISAIDLSYDTTDAVEDFTVTWTYDYYENGFEGTGNAETKIPSISASTT